MVKGSFQYGKSTERRNSSKGMQGGNEATRTTQMPGDAAIATTLLTVNQIQTKMR
jgi:hypothetical protein